MKILVIEDKEIHQKAAEETLAGHDLTIAKSFDEAIDLMNEKLDEVMLQELFEAAGFLEMPPDGDPRRRAYWNLLDEFSKKSIKPFPYEAVLTDMMMPISYEGLGPNRKEKFGDQVPYGFVLALRAAQRGAKFVAMVTDTNHHDSAMSHSIDHIGAPYYHGDESFHSINGAKCLFLHAPLIEEPGDEPCGCKGTLLCEYCNGTGQRSFPGSKELQSCNVCHEDYKCTYCKDSGKKMIWTRKDWGRVLKHLLDGPSREE